MSIQYCAFFGFGISWCSHPMLGGWSVELLLPWLQIQYESKGLRNYKRPAR